MCIIQSTLALRTLFHDPGLFSPRVCRLLLLRTLNDSPKSIQSLRLTKTKTKTKTEFKKGSFSYDDAFFWDILCVEAKSQYLDFFYKAYSTLKL